MLKKIIITVLLIIYFFSIYHVFLFMTYWFYFSVVNDCFIAGPSACRLDMTIMGTLTLISLILSPLNTLIFIKSNKKNKWLLILNPIILSISVFIIYYIIKY